VPPAFVRAQSPGLRQWWALKARHYDALLLFKVGKFYELYHMDAVVAVRELGLTFMRVSGLDFVGFRMLSLVFVEGRLCPLWLPRNRAGALRGPAGAARLPRGARRADRNARHDGAAPG